MCLRLCRGGCSQASREQTSGARAPPSEKRLRRKQCDLPLDLLRVEEKRDSRERGNLLDDGLDVCVYESEEPRGVGQGWAGCGHEEKAHRQTPVNSVASRREKCRGDLIILTSCTSVRRDHARQPLVTRRVAPGGFSR